MRPSSQESPLRRSLFTWLLFTLHSSQSKMDYEKQGTDFLEKFGVKMRNVFLGRDFYFDGDNAMRDIWQVEFTKPGQPEVKPFKLKFGQSIVNSGKGKGPSAYDVLACLTKYDPGIFDDFCSDFGYDIDSRRAKKTYKAVVKEWQKVSNFFKPSELEQLQEIQ